MSIIPTANPRHFGDVILHLNGWEHQKVHALTFKKHSKGKGTYPQIDETKFDQVFTFAIQKYRTVSLFCRNDFFLPGGLFPSRYNLVKKISARQEDAARYFSLSLS